MEDLIQNVDILFDERPPPSSPVPSPDMTETTSTITFGSFFSPEFPHPTEVEAGSTTRHHPGGCTRSTHTCRGVVATSAGTASTTRIANYPAKPKSIRECDIQYHRSFLLYKFAIQSRGISQLPRCEFAIYFLPDS
jgi:hypothetical protein